MMHTIGHLVFSEFSIFWIQKLLFTQTLVMKYLKANESFSGFMGDFVDANFMEWKDFGDLTAFENFVRIY